MAAHLSDPRRPVPVRDPAGRVLCTGWLEEDIPIVPLQVLAEALGLAVEWEQATGEARLRWPGGR